MEIWPIGCKFIIAQNIFASLKLLGYLKVSKDRVLLDAREQNSHGVCAVVQEWNTSSVQIAGQLVNVCLQLCKSCGRHTTWTNRLRSLIKTSQKLENNLWDSGEGYIRARVALVHPIKWDTIFFFVGKKKNTACMSIFAQIHECNKILVDECWSSSFYSKCKRCQSEWWI